MIPIFSASQVKSLDAQEIAVEGITSFDLMRRASSALYSRLTELMANRSDRTVAEMPKRRFVVLASGGNNGGDALCVADMLRSDYEVVVFYIKVSDRQTADFAQAYANVKDYIDIYEISSVDDIEKMRPFLQKRP